MSERSMEYDVRSFHAQQLNYWLRVLDNNLSRTIIFGTLLMVHSVRTRGWVGEVVVGLEWGACLGISAVGPERREQGPPTHSFEARLHHTSTVLHPLNSTSDQGVLDTMPLLTAVPDMQSYLYITNHRGSSFFCRRH